MASYAVAPPPRRRVSAALPFARSLHQAADSSVSVQGAGIKALFFFGDHVCVTGQTAEDGVCAGADQEIHGGRRGHGRLQR